MNGVLGIATPKVILDQPQVVAAVGQREAAGRGCKPKPPKIPTPQLQLPSAIAQVGGKKELTGRIDIEIEISNPCARLIANVIIYYNSAILSRLLTKEASGNVKALALIKKLSPAAWRHIHLNGHYTFRGDGQVIDLDAIVAELELGCRNFRGFGLTTPNTNCVARILASGAKPSAAAWRRRNLR